MRTNRCPKIGAWVAVLTLVVLAGCDSSNQFVPPPPPAVTVAQPVMRKIADSIEFRGKLEATATVDLRARVNGYLEKIDFADGTDVVVGQKLFQIEQAPYLAALDSAKAAVLKAEAARDLAQSQYRRMEPLVAQRAITQEELDIQAAQVSTALADLAAAEAAVRTAELNLQYTTIRAPISGHIGRHLVDVGNLVQAEATQLAVIESIDPIYAIFDVSERDLLRFKSMVRQDELPDPDKNPPVLFLKLENEREFTHEGTLAFRELGLDPGTATAYRRGLFANPNHDMLPGMSVDIRAQIGEPIPKLMVEDRAVGSDQRGNFLLIVNDKNVVEYRPVKLGIASGGMRVVEEGIQATDWVIINGLQRAPPGSEVKPERTRMMTDKEREAAAAKAETEARQEGASLPTTPESPESADEMPGKSPGVEQPPATQESPTDEATAPPGPPVPEPTK